MEVKYIGEVCTNPEILQDVVWTVSGKRLIFEGEKISYDGKFWPVGFNIHKNGVFSIICDLERGNGRMNGLETPFIIRYTINRRIYETIIENNDKVGLQIETRRHLVGEEWETIEEKRPLGIRASKKAFCAAG